MSATLEIRDSITIQRPRSDVFRALTDASELGNWMATRAESDPRTGGGFSYTFEFEDISQDNAQAGRYLAIEADRRVAIPWLFPFSPTATTVEFELDGDGGVTEVRFSHTGFESGEPWDTARIRFGPGWQAFLRSLKTWVEDRTPSRPLGVLGPEARLPR